MRILLAEDDVKLGQLMVHYIKKQSIDVDWVKSGAEAYEACLQERSNPYDVVLLDWMMPDMPGVDVVRKLRGQRFQRAIILITARDAIDDRVAGLSAGADDYIVKPFAMPELIARIHAMTRRNFSMFEADLVHVADMELDRTRHTARRAEREIGLSQREFALLEWFVRHPTHIFSKEALLERIWGSDSDVTMNAVEAAVKLLRKKMALLDAEHWIETVRGVGYRFAKTRDS